METRQRPSPLREMTAMELARMPNGTIYTSVDNPEALCQKVEDAGFTDGSGNYVPDWFEQLLHPSPESLPYEPVAVGMAPIVMDTVPGRWGLFERDARFYVYDREQLLQLREAVELALSAATQ